MPELLTPGVYIQEVEFGPQPIEGVSTSTAGFAGVAERGLDSGPPVLVTSFPDFQRKFGGFLTGAVLPLAVRGFFDNGGRRAYVARVVGTPASGAAAAALSVDTDGTAGEAAAVKLLAPFSGTSLAVSSTVGIGGSINLIEKSTGTPTAGNVASISPFTNLITLTAAIGSFDPADYYVAFGTHAAASGVLQIAARDKGDFGDRVSVLVDAQYGDNATVVAQPDTTHLVLSSVGFLAVGDKIEVFNAAGTFFETDTVLAVDPGTRIVTLTNGVTAATYSGGRAFRLVWRLTVMFDGAVVETLTGLSAALTGGVAQAMQDEVEARSQWVRLSVAPSIDPTTDAFPTFAMGEAELLASGSDGTIGDSDVVARLPDIEAQQGISIIAAPGFDQQTVVNELIAQAERRMDRFAVFGAETADADVGALLSQRGRYNSKYAAMYAPWVQVTDPLTNLPKPLQPVGHIIGCYARTDNDRGVFKAPANVVIRGILGFSRVIPDGEQDILNPSGVDVLRHFDGLGDVIWGARTISSEGLWKYVPVRRLFIFLEQSIIRGTRYAVFEPNDQRLWARIRDSVTNFLTTQWRAGALFGSKPEEAFFVKVDETTTTQDDRDNGIVNILVGIAPVKPAEFVVFQIGQAPTSIIIAERGA